MNRINDRHLRTREPVRRGLIVTILSGIFVLGGCLTSPLAASDFEPKGVVDVVLVQPFQLDEAFEYDWRSERPTVQSGLLVVLKVDPELVVPRNALEPVLYAGDQTVQRLNHGHESGYVIGIIPEQIDLSKEPVWFGTPALPESVDAGDVASERSKAERSGIQPSVSVDLESRTRARVVASDLTTLLHKHAADLVLQYSPQEKRLADAWRLAADNR